MNCPNCGSENIFYNTSYDGKDYYICGNCKTHYSLPTVAVSKTELTTAEMQEWLVENKYDILLRKNKSMIYSCTLYFYDENSLKKANDRAGNTLAEAIKQAYDWAKKQEVTSE